MLEGRMIEGEPYASDERGEVPKYLASAVAVARAARPGEYVVAHLRTGTFLRTDRLGALTVRAMVKGSSDQEAAALVDRLEAGSGERAKRLIFALHIKGALTATRPPSGRRRRLRAASAMLSIPLAAVGPLVRIVPIAALTWIVRDLPATRIARRVSGPGRATLKTNLQASGYSGRELDAAMKPTRSLNHLFMFVSVTLQPRRLNRLVDRLFDRESVDRLVSGLDESGATVGVFLHGPMCAAVPNALRLRGRQVTRVVVPWTHGMFVSPSSGHMGDFFGDPQDAFVAEVDPRVTPGHLLRHLKAGRSVYVTLDAIMHVRDSVTGELHKPRAAAEIDLLGRRFLRNDGPAWLSVLSGRPLALWTTFYSSTGVVLQSSQLLHPDPALRTEDRVAALSRRLYACAEVAIREHPEAWRYWGLLDLITVDARELRATPSSLGV
jgi:hypothetical protein